MGRKNRKYLSIRNPINMEQNHMDTRKLSPTLVNIENGASR